MKAKSVSIIIQALLSSILDEEASLGSPESLRAQANKKKREGPFEPAFLLVFLTVRMQSLLLLIRISAPRTSGDFSLVQVM